MSRSRLDIPKLRLALLDPALARQRQKHVVHASCSEPSEQHHVSHHKVHVHWPKRELACRPRGVLQSEERAYTLPQGGEHKVSQGDQEDQVERDSQLVIHHGSSQHATDALLFVCVRFLPQETRRTRAKCYVLNSFACSCLPRSLARTTFSRGRVCGPFLRDCAVAGFLVAVGERVEIWHVLQAAACLRLFHVWLSNLDLWCFGYRQYRSL